MTRKSLSFRVFLGPAVALAIFASPALSQTGDAAAERCASFNALSERHGNSARDITAKAQAQAKSMPAADAERFLAANEAGAKSEWEMSALARDAYRKCMQDYLAGGSAAPQQAVEEPRQQQAVQQPSPQARPKQTQQQVQQKPRVQQARQVKQEQLEPEPQPMYRPVLPGLIGFGLGLGLGGIRP